MVAQEPLDLTNLPRFIDHLRARDAGLSTFVRGLLGVGWEVSDFWGPEQMDVWALRLHSNGRALRFGIERGFVDGVLVGSDGDRSIDFYPLSYAVLGWARSTGAVVPLEDPDHFSPDIGAHGWAALDWLAAGNDGNVARIRSAWKAYFELRYAPDSSRNEEWLAKTKAHGIRLIEQAAADSAGDSLGTVR
ncbi:hypothetical protein GCM10009860_05900 [Microbacterium mitrae]|uniref:Uncharacterized protein n=1 Tax=Microbacterium mitrae TaxID=664640 RepID=A0A5C8HPN9_9MICO|nr:hypothetical protein [Microbacterium mitrae]TXK05974.1 hypothetical protein FVP60_03085 [Microbacterium mitrae]